MRKKKKKLAVWALTSGGMDKLSVIVDSLEGAHGYCPKYRIDEGSVFEGFGHFKTHVRKVFNDYEGHVFIMALGIVVRVIAPLIRDKINDPAVVVVDEKAQYAISLLSGHLGGANALVGKVAEILGSLPVITTATDVYGLKAFDTAAADMGLYIENPKAIKALNSALLEKRNIRLIDSMKIISPFYENNAFVEILGDVFPVEKDGCKGPAVYVGDGLVDPTSEFLVMRPASLVAGIGCNRGTGLDELRKGVEDVFKESGLSIKSLRNLATIELKRDEEGINEFADMLDVPVDYFSSEELNEVKEIENPSRVVKKYTGTEGVCEAAALLSAKTERLVVPKRILKNMTIAVARVNSMS